MTSKQEAFSILWNITTFVYLGFFMTIVNNPFTLSNNEKDKLQIQPSRSVESCSYLSSHHKLTIFNRLPQLLLQIGRKEL